MNEIKITVPDWFLYVLTVVCVVYVYYQVITAIGQLIKALVTWKKK